ncbi:MFS transporter, partial [Streptomyces tendae]|uniref:MFS transporter n=1 Tax=Streptomyces tendae TaxID=1932 RepID=UPI0036A69F5E
AVDVGGALGGPGVCSLLAAGTLGGTGRASAEAVPPRTPGSGAAGTLREGIALVRGDAALLRVLLMTAVAGLVLTGPLTVGVPWLAAERYGAGPATFGVMLSMWTAGSLGGVVLAGALSRMPSINRLLLVVAAVIGTALVALGLAPGMIVAGAALLLMGVGAGCFNVLVMTWLQERTDQAVLGRLMSFVELAEVATTPVSYLLAGALLGVSVSGLYVAAALVFVLSAAAMLTPRADRLLSVGGRP